MGLLPDELLARRAARGDKRAFEAIYQRYNQRLYRFCLAMVGNPQDAQDALQNAMVKVLRALPGEQRQIRLKPWLYRIARNESVEVLRRRRESGELDPEQEAAGSVAETAEAREILRVLFADFAQLPERQRAVLVMRELSGLDFAEIGEAFDTSAAVARQTLYEARLSLRRLEAGREMRCADVMRELSDAEGRTIRRREIRAHLHDCADCRAFGEGIGRRRDELAAIAPLPLAASAGLLHGILGAQAGASAAIGGVGAGASAGAGALATSTIVKSAATVAVATVVGVSAADRGGLVDLPLPGGGRSEGSAAREATRSHDSQQPAGAGVTPATSDAPALPGALGDAKPAKDGAAPLGGARETDSKRSDSLKRAVPQNTPPESSAGASPPGGGYGSSATERRGQPESLPAAAKHGQQTAAARKPAHAGAPSTQEASGNSGTPAGLALPKVKPVPLPKPPPPPPHPLAPPVAPPVTDTITPLPVPPSVLPPTDTDLP